MGSAKQPPSETPTAPASQKPATSRASRAVRCTECDLRSTTELITRQGERAADGQAFGRCKNRKACERRQRRKAAAQQGKP